MVSSRSRFGSPTYKNVNLRLGLVMFVANSGTENGQSNGAIMIQEIERQKRINYTFFFLNKDNYSLLFDFIFRAFQTLGNTSVGNYLGDVFLTSF